MRIGDEKEVRLGLVRKSEISFDDLIALLVRLTAYKDTSSPGHHAVLKGSDLTNGDKT